MIEPPEPLALPTRPASWPELAAAWVFGFIVGAAVLYLLAGCPTSAEAGGPANVTWDQAGDCALIAGWDLLQASITTAKPDPQPPDAQLGLSIANTGTPPCGLGITKTLSLTGVGPTRFWMQAVSGGTKSGVSNRVDLSLPLAKPSGLTIVLP